MLTQPWRIQLLGTLTLRHETQIVTRFRTQKTAALLAYMAYHAQRNHSREQLAELFWPDQQADAARNSLRVALASLRAQLEPPGEAVGAVLITDRTFARLNTQAIVTDAAEFEKALRLARQKAGAEPDACIGFLQRAVTLYQGELLPGYYEEWILSERERLANAHRASLRLAATLLERRGDYEPALDMALRAVSSDPLDEEMHCSLLRLYVALGRTDNALRHYQELERLLREEMDVAPLPETRALAHKLLGDLDRETARPTASPLPPQPPASPAAPRPDPAPVQTPRLPIQFTRFFGREAELESLLDRLQPCAETAPYAPLLTLTGLGGIGKSRLATEAARRLAEAYRGAVWFVPLAGVADPGLISQAIYDALRPSDNGAVEPLEGAARFLNDLPAALLLLDNFEHLAEDGAPAIRSLRERAPRVTLLITSRHLLGLEGEQDIPLGTLPLPASETQPETLLRCPSVRLFVDRAQASRPDFQVTTSNTEAISGLCRRLEGIPLAIELAAARAMALTPAQMLKQMEERFDFLVSRRKDLPARQRTLRAAVEWSCRVLTEELQRLFVRLSVFRGGWTLEAAEAVCEEPLALECLEQLCERSLVHTSETSGLMRFGMLETLREYSAEQQAERDDPDRARIHAGYFLALTESASEHWGAAGEGLWLDRLEEDHDNLRAALRWLLQHATWEETCAENALTLASALSWFWYVRGYFSEGCRWLEEALRRGEKAAPALRARVLMGLGRLERDQGHPEKAAARYTTSLALFRELGDDRSIASALHNLGLTAIDRRDLQLALDCYEEAMPLWRKLGERRGLSISLHNLGLAALHREDYDRAWQLCTESLELCREADYRWGVATASATLGLMAHRRGDYALAGELLEEALAIQREIGNRRNMVYTLTSQGLNLIWQQKPEAASECLREAWEIARAVEDRAGQSAVLEALSELETRRGRNEQANRLLSASEGLRESMESPLSRMENAVFTKRVEALREALDADAFVSNWRAGRALPVEALVAEVDAAVTD